MTNWRTTVTALGFVLASLAATPAAAADLLSWEVGDEHACIANDCGIVHCWGGTNQFYQEDLSAVGGPWTDVAVGTDHSCALDESGFVDCWGRNDDNQLDPPEQDFVSIDGGLQHTCGVRANDEVTCWGSDNHGESSGVRPNTFYRQVSAGAKFSCAVTSGRNAIDCWGDVPGGVHRILSWDFLRNHGPTPTGAPERFDEVSAGHQHVCFTTNYNKVYCWGANGTGQLSPHFAGDAKNAQIGDCVGQEPGTPLDDCVSTQGDIESEIDDPGSFGLVRVDLGYTWLDVDAGGLGTCGVHFDVATGDNDVLCWGYPYEFGWGNRLQNQPGWPPGFSPTDVDISTSNACAWSVHTDETFCAAHSAASSADEVPEADLCEPLNW